MGDVALDPAVAAMVDGMAAAGLPPFHTLDPIAARGLMATMQQGMPPYEGPRADVNDVFVQADDHAVGVRVYSPPDSLGRLVYAHGGGWVLGELPMFDRVCHRLSVTSGFEVLSVDYRLAPEHPYPAALDDVVSVVRWAAGRSPRGPLALAGDSAGGNLAAAAALRLRDEDGPRIALQALLYPVCDRELDTPSQILHADGPFVTGRDMEWYWRHYLGVTEVEAAPYACPLRASILTGLPPAHVVLAGHDPLHDEGMAYAGRLQAAGVPVTIDDRAAMPHGFAAMEGVIDDARSALEGVSLALRASAEAWRA
jgi:acetyl esterase